MPAWATGVDSSVDALNVAVALKLGSAAASTTYVPLTDGRLADARTPIAHTHAASAVTGFDAAAAAAVLTAVTTKGIANIGSIGTTEVVLATAPSITGDGAKRFKITASFKNMVSTVATDVFVLRIKNGAAVIKEHQVFVYGSSAGGWAGSGGQDAFTTDVPAVGTHAYSCVVARVLGTGLGTVEAAAVAPLEILIERIT